MFGIGGANGLDFMVPSGFPNDSFGPIFAQSGERVRVETPEQQRSGNVDNSKSVKINNYFPQGTDSNMSATRMAFQLRNI